MGNARHTRRAQRASPRFVRPRCESASVSTSGIRRATAARPTGPATYPPPPRTTSGRCAFSSRRARTTAPTAFPTARAALSGFEREMPSTAMGSKGMPSAGTSSRSARSPPIQTTSAPSAPSAPAPASAGTTWPAVPPAAITTFTLDHPQLHRVPRGDVEQHPDRGQQDEGVRLPVGDERQGHAGERREPEDHEDVERRLAQDEGGQTGGEELGIGSGGLPGGPQPGPEDHPVERDDAAQPGHAEFLPDDGEDEVRMRLGQVEDLLDRLPEPDAEEPARAERDLSLHRLEAGAARVAPRVDEGREPRDAIGLVQRGEEDQSAPAGADDREVADRHAARD